jgi:hypothetical protein
MTDRNCFLRISWLPSYDVTVRADSCPSFAPNRWFQICICLGERSRGWSCMNRGRAGVIRHARGRWCHQVWAWRTDSCAHWLWANPLELSGVLLASSVLKCVKVLNPQKAKIMFNIIYIVESICLFVCLSVWRVEEVSFYWTEFHESHIWGFFKNLSRKFKFA